MGWGNALDRLLSRILPTRETALKDQEDALERRRNEINSKKNITSRDIREYERVLEQLRDVRKKIKNSAGAK